MLGMVAGGAGVRVVSAYRPFPPESAAHRRLGPFDWPAAIRTLRASVARSCGCETVAITDRDTALDGPTLQYATTERRLMLWILDVSLAYLASDDFDRDTIFVSPDSLVLQDLRPYFGADATVLIRSADRYQRRPILNAVQWWRVAAKDALVAFYRQALDLALTLPEGLVVWGADSEPLRQLLDPIHVGIHRRAGLRVRLLESVTVLRSLSGTAVAAMDRGEPPPIPDIAVWDFKGPRKQYLPRCAAALGWSS